MKKLLFVLFGALILCSCAEPECEQYYGEDATVELKKKGKKHYVPFKGVFETQIISAGDCAEGFCVEVIGTGKATHLGKTEMVDNEVNQYAYVTFTAANGDILKGDFVAISGEQVGPIYYFEGDGTVNGGESTGRFEGASGSLASKGSVNVVEGVGQVVFTGEIMY